MTDNDIIKALENALAMGDSPIGEQWGVLLSKQKVKNALDLINRQKAEIERLEEKQIPKKVKIIDERADTDFYYLAFVCPSCGESVIGQPYRPNNCKHCGQKLDWGDEEMVGESE